MARAFSSRRAFLVGASALTASSCGHALYEQPSDSWQVVRSPHFRLYTDASARSYTLIVERLEEVYQALTSSFFQGVTVPTAEVMLFNSGVDADDVIGRADGVYHSGIGPNGLLAMRDAGDNSYAFSVAAHELAHKFILARYPRIPVFLNEGMAAYFETIKVAENEVWLGARPAVLRQMAQANQIIPLSQLLQDSSDRFHAEFELSHYASSWLFMHFVFHEGKDEGTLNRRVAPLLAPFARRTGDADPKGAILAAFPDTTLEQLDERVHAYAAYMSSKRSNTVLSYPFVGEGLPDLKPEPADRTLVRDYARGLRPNRLELKW